MEPMEANHWWRLFRLMQQNHVAALCFDAVSKAGAPRDVLMPWLSEHEKAIEWHRYQRQVQQEVVDVMQQRGIETLVLKGTHTAQYYPQPELREFGDLDLYFYDKHDEADRVAREVLRVSVSNDAHHHTKYNYKGVTVESHYDFLNIHYPPSNRRYEAMLKELVSDGDVSLLTSHFSLFEVLFLLRHMAGHFAASRITLRDLVDWTLTCHALQNQVDWGLVRRTASDYGMEPFLTALNAIAEGQDADNRIMKDIVYGDIQDHNAENVGRLLWKLRRWRANDWKRRMVYNDSSFSLFLASLTSHAEKPQSILHKM